VKRSLNEVERICRKAAEGAGAPAGLDTDAADGAAWLLARDLPALNGLAGDLTGFPDLAAACRFARGSFGGAEELDLNGKACTVIAPMLVDLLVARAARNAEPSRLRATGLSSPLFLLPPAVGHAAQGHNDRGWSFNLSLSNGTGDRSILRVAAGGEVEILATGGTIAALFEAGTDWVLEAVCASLETDELSRTDLPSIVDGEQLDALAMRSLAEGVSPDPGPWGRLQALAAKVLVPATEQSHLMGAGALGSDSE
jgi:hypothetical protein